MMVQHSLGRRVRINPDSRFREAVYMISYSQYIRRQNLILGMTDPCGVSQETRHFDDELLET